MESVGADHHVLILVDDEQMIAGFIKAVDVKATFGGFAEQLVQKHLVPQFQGRAEFFVTIRRFHDVIAFFDVQLIILLGQDRIKEIYESVLMGHQKSRLA